MRKIMVMRTVNVETFAPVVTVFEVTGPGERDILLEQELHPDPKRRYTHEEMEKINLCNSALSSKGKDPLTEEEVDYMLDPGGRRKRLEVLEEALDDAETMQRMAGYRVEKHVIPLDKDHNSGT